MNTKEAVRQLEQSERGQDVIALLKVFLSARPVIGLDMKNREAVCVLVNFNLMAPANESSQVMDFLDESVVFMGIRNLAQADQPIL